MICRGFLTKLPAGYMSPIDKALLERYMNGECTPEEEDLVHCWLDENDAGEYPEVHSVKKYDRKIRSGWRRLAGQLAEYRIVPMRRRAVVIRRAAAVAASGLIVAVSSLYTCYRMDVFRYKQEYQTASGEIKRIHLDDGTAVTLNARSTLKVERGFNEADRKVTLEGEAYFQVKQDAARPFIVNSGKLSVTVLGTSFDVSAFSKEPEMKVSLKEGKVLITAPSQEKAEQMILSPGDEAVFNQDTRELSLTKLNPREIYSWQVQVIYFENAGMQEVTGKLERFYGVTFDTHLLRPARWQLNGEYRNQTLREVLESLAFNYNLKFSIEGNKVILY